MGDSNNKTELKKSDAQKMLAWALTERIEGSPNDEEMDLPGYEILGVLGRGGMGTVYKAKQKDSGKTVALKIFTGKGRQQDLLVERLKREGRLLAKLEHSNVVGIYDGDVTADGVPYLVLEYVEGEDLRKHIFEAKRLKIKDAIRIAVKICNGLTVVHEMGVIHRDIKPANVLLGNDGTVKISDFGVSKESSAGKTSLTMTGTAIGTVDYMSPEQSNGEAVDERSDIYSVGVILYEMISGVTPKGAFEPLLKYGAPKELDRLVMRCLQRDPSKRPASSANLAIHLKKVYQKLRKRRNRDKSAIFYSVFAGAAAIAVLGMFMARAVRDKSQERDFEERLSSLQSEEPETVEEMPLPVGQWVSLTQNLRASEASISGQWWVTSNSVVCAAENDAMLRLNVAPKPSYKLEFSMTRVAGDGVITMFLPSSIGLLDLTFDKEAMTIPAFGALKGGQVKIAPCSFELGKEYRIQLEVESSSVRAFVDGEPCSTWDLTTVESLDQAPKVNFEELALKVDQSQVIFKDLRVLQE